jgi:hypothetical protein
MVDEWTVRYSAFRLPRSAFLVVRCFLFLQQPIQIQSLREHFNPAVRRARPFFARTIPIKFHAIIIRVAQIERLAHPMVRGPLKFNARRERRKR